MNCCLNITGWQSTRSQIRHIGDQFRLVFHRFLSWKQLMLRIYFEAMCEIKVKVKKKTQFSYYEIELSCERLFHRNAHDYPWHVILVLTTDRQVKMKDNRKICRCVFSSLLYYLLISLCFSNITSHRYNLNSLQVELNKFMYLDWIVSVVIRLKKPTDFTTTSHDNMLVS